MQSPLRIAYFTNLKFGFYELNFPPLEMHHTSDTTKRAMRFVPIFRARRFVSYRVYEFFGAAGRIF